MKNLQLYIVFTLFTTMCFAQFDSIQYNADDLTRLTFGVHKSYYKAPEVTRRNAETKNVGGFDLSNSQGYFINYKILKYRNHSIKAGLFLNSLQHELWYKGKITDIKSGELRDVSSRPNFLSEKMLSLEYCLDYSYLLKINDKWFLDLSVGLSQERNQSYEIYTIDAYFSEADLIPYQNVASSVYFYKSKFTRTNLGAAVGYKSEYGMVNIGLKYSFAKSEVAYGQYEFFDPLVSEGSQGYGLISLSGDYVSATLSFTPSKSIFKKKK